MIKEWFSSKELIEIEGMPSTTQGINRKARVENWKSRKRKGIQGKAIEYHISSLPDFVQNALRQGEVSTFTSVEPIQLWVTMFHSLKDNEKQEVTSWLMRNGMKAFIDYIMEQNAQ